jgi:hypothetical protein
MDRGTSITGLIQAQLALGAVLKFRVVSGSMAPLVAPGDEVVVAATSVESLRPGDIIVAQAPGRPFVVHRLVAIQPAPEGNGFITRGDRSGMADPAWRADALVGRAVAVQRGDRMIDLARGRGRMAVVVQGWLARIEAASYQAGRSLASGAFGARLPRLGGLVRAPFRALARLVDYVLR